MNREVMAESIPIRLVVRSDDQQSTRFRGRSIAACPNVRRRGIYYGRIIVHNGTKGRNVMGFSGERQNAADWSNVDRKGTRRKRNDSVNDRCIAIWMPLLSARVLSFDNLLRRPARCWPFAVHPGPAWPFAWPGWTILREYTFKSYT